MLVAFKRVVSGLAVTVAVTAVPAVHALTFDLDYGDGVSGVLNTVVTAGVGVRMQNRSSDLVAKGNLDPTVCGEHFQSCQGVFRDQHHPAARLASAPGQATYNADDGNLNYDRYDLTQGVFKVTQDINLTYGNFGFFAKWLYFYDFVNNDFTNYHPNRITPENVDQVGTTGGPNNTLFSRVYGPGGVVHEKRSDGEVLRQIGTDLQWFDAYFYGSLPLFADRELIFKLGRQTVNWGESTVLLINSVNQANPINANNLGRVGFDLSELFVPTGMAFISTQLFDSATIEFFYGYEWKPVEIFAPGSFLSFLDIGTNNAIDFVGFNFGTPAEDPYQLGFPAENPLSGLTNTTTAIKRMPDNTPKDSGQFGLALKYFADWLNNGTEISLYFMNYHSKLPYVSFFASDMSCARQGADHSQDGGMDIDATNGIELLLACPDLPLVHNQFTDDDPGAATSDAVPFDTVRFRLEYPENIQMYGISFNTTWGDWSFQGEVAYRPDMPLQVDAEDLAFHSVGPTLGSCHRPDAGCSGTSGGAGAGPDGSEVTYESSDFTPYPGSGVTAYPDTFDLAAGAGVGSARSFPSFIGAWRGVEPGETPPNSYIRGWEYFDVWQFNLGATYVQGATEWLPSLIGADQMIWLFELGVQWVPGLPGTDRLQIEAPGTFYHASAGADGSGTGNYRQDCAHTPDCHYSGVRPDGSTFGDPGINGTYGDGLRFNPHQENHDAYADKFSTGYAIVNLTRYESVFPGISFQPITIFMHDVHGTSTDAAAQFTHGRMDVIFLFETRYREALSFYVGYNWITGGGKYNLQRDRDQALMYLKYQF
jgi:hypothetical protein